MSFLSKSFSVLGKLAIVGLLLGTFLAGMAGVVYMSLSGSEIKVPEIVGKDFVESEKQLAALGLKIKRRADRATTDKINTVLEQLPRAGETVKTGQLILVVVSKAGADGEEVPSSLRKDLEDDDSEKIEEMISDKPKKPKANTNTNKKKADTTRDVIANTATSTTNSAASTGTSAPGADKKEPAGDPDRGNKTDQPGVRPQSSPGPNKPSSARPSGDQRPRQPSRPR